MATIRVVTDSAANIPPQRARELGVEVLPLRVHLGDEVYREGVDVEPQKFLERLRATSMISTVSPPPVEEFVAAYGRLSRTADEILSIHVSRRICDTLHVARQASQEYLGRCRITVMDSMVFDLGQRVLVEKAVHAARAGLDMQEIVRVVRGLIPRLYAIFFTDNLHCLERGKRIGPAQAILGTMLGIKPILTLEDGDILPLEKVRTTEQALEKLAEFVAEFSQVEEIAVLQSGFTEDTRALLELLAPLLPEREIPTAVYGPSLAVHLGPSAMGVMVFESEE
ncbi:MAG: DegV family protein [Anaerolineae bacterium]|nr:DegV family protein [Anaerolineae bacterium]